MAIISNAGATGLAIRNRPTATPPIMFSDFGPGAHFSYCIWAKVTDNTIPETLLVYQGTSGSRFVISAQLGYFLFELRNESAVAAQYGIIAIQLNTWTAICVTINDINIKVYAGIEDPTQDVPVHLTEKISVGILTGFTFDFVAMVTSHNMAICNFRYFDVTLGPTDIDIHVNRWAANGPYIPKWSSTLRLPGDISNIVGLYTSPDWYTGHGFDAISPNISNLLFHTPDPVWLAKHEPCPVWVYQNPPFDTPPIGYWISHNPGTVPGVPTTYKANHFHTFLDKGTVAVGALESVYIVLYPITTGTGPGPASSYPLYINEADVELITDLNDPTQRFEQDTNVLVPNSIICPNMYLWKFGGQFTWAAGAGPAGTGNLGYPYLYVTYIGYPTGSPSIITIDDLAGLFAIKKDQLIDQYYRSTKRKIPDPTIRTALIGE